MSSNPLAGRRRHVRLLGLATASLAVALTGALVAPSPTVAADPASPASDRQIPKGSAPSTYDAGRYVVVLKAAPAASYDGSNRRFAATRAAGGQQFRADSAATRAYTTYLRRTQDALAGKVGATAREHYTIALNGFAARLTGPQATRLSQDKSVLLLAEDALLKKDTWNTPTFLGLDGPGGAWTAHGSNRKNAGGGIVVGDIDSGYWPGPSFSGAPLSTAPVTKWDITMDGDGNTRMEKLDGSVFRGQCETGQAFTTSNCTSKVIGARYYPDAYLDQTAPEDRPDSEYISPRDGSGHGSHTASTAAGGVTGPVSVEGRTFGTVSGMAPAAKLAIYKVCFENVDPDLSGCATSASLAAIDDAVADGVDVINYSISGAQDTVLDAVELAFEGAAEAGVFVAASAGNSGPTAATVAHNSPWLTTVAAGTHVNFEATIVLADGNTLVPDKIVGASIIGAPVGRRPIVTAEASVVAGGDAADARICGPDTLDPAKVADKIVVCYRGTYDRVAKSAEVERAGGAAMILVNPTPNSLDADFHAVPTVHISDTDGATLADFLATATAPTALFSPGNKTSDVTPLPQVAGFSSRGPALAQDGDILKPDITAPGASVLAAVAPPSNQGRAYDLYSGTSMSAPHITGLAAFLLGVHPEWTPMQIKSAMMTTASKMKNATGGNSSDVFATGAGQVDPKKFFDPGLFVTETGRGWRGFITGQGLDTGVPAVEAKDLNLPSFADGGVAGSTTITRSFRASRVGTWKISSYLPGFTVTPSVAKVVSKRVNDVVDVTFTFTRTTAPLGTYAKGTITLAGPTLVRMPVAMRPVLVDAPTSVTGTGGTGSVEVPVTAGFTGTLDLTATGLVAPSAGSYSDAIPVGEFYYDCWTVTPGTTRAAIFDVDAVDDTADLDLTVYSASACDFAAIDAIAGTSATGSADERVVIADPDHPVYITEVAGYAAGQGGAPIAFSNASYDVGGGTAVGDLTVAPDPLPVTQAEDTSYTASWTGLVPNRYFGLVDYAGSTDTTLLQVDVAGCPPVRPAGARC
ncbi:S8 family serine peptidase [Nocardioides rubriscoriae]|uniref:S8 family serine peptidase n=1 Tax=Nocardioides rubriscoriae TaxID=642762 RepID=UPI00147966A3|nr:S8 family serine peptidase [Nocardioides rubriscoriae]